MERTTHTPAADATFQAAPNGTSIVLSGRLDAAGAARIWEKTVAAARKGASGVVVDASNVSYCSGPGVGLLLEIELIAQKNGVSFDLTGLKPEFMRLLELHDPERFKEPEIAPPVKSHLPVEVGRETVKILGDIRNLIAFVGEFAAAMAAAVRRPSGVRWRDAFVVAENVGVNAFPIIVMIGFLAGLIMAFQSAVPLRQFGADIYVANLLGISVTREIAPLITAAILTGRSGSAFAAEIGTMTVNEEINALVTMGLDPIRFLVVTRVLGAMIVTPILSVFFTLFSLVGGAVVMRAFGYPLVTYINQLAGSMTVGDTIGGLFKCVVLGVLVCGVGCMRGLQTKGGPSAVGDATTSAVVSGIILIAVMDGLFAVTFYALGI